MASDSRKKNYKHTGLDSEELRKRREDLNITLRKQKREEQVRINHRLAADEGIMSLFSSILNDEI